jgi:hypothetical protein
MSARNTSTGAVLENMILPSLRMGKYEYELQKVIGTRPGGRKHKIDAVASKEDGSYLISLKWQQVNGTAEQKVPFEVICLLDALQQNPQCQKAYLVLGGDGWTLRNLYTSGGLQKYLLYGDRVEIITLERFIAKANTGKL